MGNGILAQAREAKFAELGSSAIVVFCLLLLLVALGILVFWWGGWWLTHRSGSQSPYGGGPLRRGRELTYAAMAELELFMQQQNSALNPRFEILNAVICQRTGRVFPDSLSQIDVAKLGWGFLKRAYSGPLASWGSLSPSQQAVIQSGHGSMTGYQTKLSSLFSEPEDGDWESWMAKPGPLYVDPATGVLVGWKCVPNTDLEVLVVQEPEKKN